MNKIIAMAVEVQPCEQYTNNINKNDDDDDDDNGQKYNSPRKKIASDYHVKFFETYLIVQCAIICDIIMDRS